MQEIVPRKQCSGCHACYNACPLSCITMEYDEEGFLYPKIDESKCTHCRKCEKVCPVINDIKGNEKGTAFACVNNDETVRKESSSGGVFSLIAETVLAEGGVVFGAAFDEDFCVRHIFIENSEELDKLRGSKYVQSRIGDAYRDVKTFLETGRMVLFSGTPCQISGLIQYLGRDYDNLILQDIVCHGVPSTKVWKKYIAFREKIAGARVQKVFFRNKRQGWKSYSVSFKFSDNTEYSKKVYEDFYMKAYLANLCLRPSCYACRSKSVCRQSDITLADFWGIEHILPEMDDNKGTSLVLIHSEKGKAIFESVSEKMNFISVDIDETLTYNSAAYKSVKKPKMRTKFMSSLDKYDFDILIKKCIPTKPTSKVFRRIKSIIKRMCSYV